MQTNNIKQKVAISIFLFVVCLFMTPLFSFAQEGEMNGSEMIIASPSPSMSITPTPDYVLPYPGLLPDSPLYVLKTMRDRLISIMIGDPIKKADFDLLQSDKRIGAAMILLEKGDDQKKELAISTISKGLNYYDESFQKASEAKKQGDSVTDLKSRMKRAASQYTYMMQQQKTKSSKEIANQLDTQLSRLAQLRQLVSSL